MAMRIFLALFALTSVASSLKLQSGELSEDELAPAALSHLLSEAEGLLQEVDDAQLLAGGEMSLLSIDDATDEVPAAEEASSQAASIDPEPQEQASAASAGNATAEAPAAEAAQDTLVERATEGANASGNASEVQADENQSRANLSTYFDPKLMAIFREKQAHLKETMKDFMVSKKELDVAKLAANLAMKKLRLATEKRRKILMGERMAEAEERRAIKENRRQAKSDMTARAEQLLEDSLGGLAGVNMSYMVDVVLALPEALQDEEFVEDFRNVTKRVDVNVRKFLDQTQQKTTQFVKDSTSASDVELRFIMAKFFHESGFRLRGLHQDSLKAIQMLRRTVPEDLERALFPFLGQLNANTVRLRINATSLATATPKEACDQITQIMANVSDYDSKLETIGKVIENVSTRVLPNMERTLQVSPNITTFVGSFLNMARLEVGGLQEAAHSMVTRASPIIAERVQCTFSSARQGIGLSFLSAVVVLATSWLHH
ncbi:unnamed protein product [Prorocentrum cordatum]|uniref:Uncharacterized protein n=1 Tax=Prorocentrum cordatum TaxID=2364126 RepID=A0ABN9QJU1_9DINO|nr:unnamed protein product [Polarella glacialis]